MTIDTRAAAVPELAAVRSDRGHHANDRPSGASGGEMADRRFTGIAPVKPAAREPLTGA